MAMTRKLIILVKINLSAFMDIPPLGILYVGDALKKAGYQVQVLHISPEQVEESVQQILDKNPLYVGFSVFTGSAMRSYAEMSRKIKRHSNIPIVWGNVHPSSLPVQCLQETYIDYVVIGEGEETAVELAQALEDQRELGEVMGIGYKLNGEIAITKPRPFIQNLDDYALDWSLVDIEQYISSFGNVNRAIRFVTSRGCPHRCGFCYNMLFNKRSWRKHSVGFVVSQINRLKEERGINGIMFMDDEFFVNKKRAISIVEQIDLPYYASCRIEYIDDEFARQLAETKCRYLLIGLESGSDRILKLINKDIKVSDIKAGLRALSNYPQIQVSGSLIFGFPTETRDEFRSTLKLIVELLDNKSNMTFTTGWYMPYPGSELYEFAIQHGFHPPKRTEDWEALDRWIDNFELTWVDWISTAETTEVRNNVVFLAFLYRFNIPLLKNIAKKQIVARDGQLGITMKGFRLLYDMIRTDHGRIFNLLRTFVLKIIWKLRDIQIQRRKLVMKDGAKKG